MERYVFAAPAAARLIVVREVEARARVAVKTLRSEVEVTGVQTQDERDEEAKKRAVDVDAADEPEAKRAK